jgi:PAS domain S-box-containing protein
MTIQRSRQSSREQVRNRSRRPVIGRQIQAAFDSLPAHIAVLDAAGTILAVNAAWRHFAESNGYADAGHGVGLNYLEICRQASESADARAAERAIRAVLAREQAEYCYEYPCHVPDQQRWFLFRAAQFAGDGPIGAIVSHEDITDYKQVEDHARGLEGTHRLASKQAEQALGEIRERMQALFDHAQDAFLMIDDAGRYIDANPAACALTGYSRAELLCLSVADLTMPADRPAVPESWQAFLGAGARHGDYTILRQDGGTVSIEFNAVAQIVPGVHLLVLRDITRRRQAEEHLRNHAERLDILHEIERTIISAHSVEQIAQAALRAMYRLIPSRRSSVVVFDFDNADFCVVAVCVDGEPSPEPPRRIAYADIAGFAPTIEALRRGEIRVIDLRDFMFSPTAAAALVAAGLLYQVCAPLIVHGELLGILQFCTSTPESFDSEYMPIIGEMLDSLAIGIQQARLFQQVRAGRERLLEQARLLVAAQEMERRQIARDLHDQVGQNLAVLNIKLAIARNQLSSEATARVDARLVDAIQIVDQTVEQIRNVMAELRPAILDDYGLVAALRWYTRHFARHTDLVVLLDVEKPRFAPRLPPDLETALFRIAQEALTNVLKHARATLATLKLTMIGQSIRLEIGDDGVGFNPAATRRPNRRWSLGLMTMQERVEAVGGRLVIDSAPGQGTRIITEVAR